MNEKKICFVICVNNAQYEAECLRYISHLRVPEGYEIEPLSIWDASSMTAGYNEGMNYSDAKYKVYLHQDVFILEKDFIYKMLEVFQDASIGMMGIVGSPTLPESGIMWEGMRMGQLLSCNVISSGVYGTDLGERPCTDVDAVDGLLMATQYDIPWREDLFSGWDYYDISQSMEFWKAGHRVVVPYMENPWCIHDDGYNNLQAYYHWQKVFLNEYGEMMKTTFPKLRKRGENADNK